MDKLQNDLIYELSNRNNCKISCDISFHVTWLHNYDYTVEFRYVIMHDRIIVSRICFTNRHSGCMTACFEILKKYAEELGYNIIIIQSVETYEMMQWCKKMNFTPADYNIDTKDEQDRDILLGDYLLRL